MRWRHFSAAASLRKCLHARTAPEAGVEGLDRVVEQITRRISDPSQETVRTRARRCAKPSNRRYFMAHLASNPPSAPSRRPRSGRVDGLEVAGELVPVLAGCIAEGVADQVDHTCLDGGLFPDRGGSNAI